MKDCLDTSPEQKPRQGKTRDLTNQNAAFIQVMKLSTIVTIATGISMSLQKIHFNTHDLTTDITLLSYSILASFPGSRVWKEAYSDRKYVVSRQLGQPFGR